MAKLLLENGEILTGKSIGYDDEVCGEISFNNSMTGYQEILTDPCNAEQVIVMTYPEIGNYGINKDDYESNKVFVKGLVIKNYCKKESHYLASGKLNEYLKSKKVVGISDVDTRKLTNIIRENGTMNCLITSNDEVTEDQIQILKSHCADKNILETVSRKNLEVINGFGKNKNTKIGIIDCGIKKSILDNLIKTGVTIHLLPYDIKADNILKGKFNAVIISNGAGDPSNAVKTISTIKELIGKISLYGIGLGFQILAIVLGGKTYKLKTGHHGGNYPVINKITNKVLITSQCHKYSVDKDSLPKNVVITYENLNDGTVEGFACAEFHIEAVQFHPELTPDSGEENKIFESWVSQIKQEKSHNLLNLVKKLGGKNAKK